MERERGNEQMRDCVLCILCDFFGNPKFMGWMWYRNKIQPDMHVHQDIPNWTDYMLPKSSLPLSYDIKRRG